MYIILTTNVKDCMPGGAPEGALTVDDRTMIAGSNLYLTRDEALAQVEKLNERYRKTKLAAELAEETGLIFTLGRNPFKTLAAPKFEVFEVLPISRVDVSMLPRLELSKTDGEDQC